MEPRRNREADINVAKYIKFVIPINPTTKKNSTRIVINKRTGKYMVIPSEKYKKYEEQCIAFVPHLGIDYSVNIKAVYYRGTKHKVDLCNLHECLLDVLVKYGCIADDNSHIVVSMDGSRVFYDKDNPRTEVWIERIEEDGEENRN
jgi:Holliday junction resolvase RusA-like endonuclease